MVLQPILEHLVALLLPSFTKRGYHVRSCWGVQSNPQKGAGYAPACLAPIYKLVLENLLWRNQSILQIVSASNIPFALNKWVVAGAVFSRNQQTSALKSLKANCTWNILFEKSAKSQALQTAGQSDVLQALVEIVAKSQALQTVGQSDVFQALVESRAKSQALQTVGQSDVLQALVETIAESQALQTVGQSDFLQALV